MLHRLLFVAFLSLTLSAVAQEPAPCALVVPTTVTANSEAEAQATCPCPITTITVKVLNRWGQAMWSASTLEGFPHALLGVPEVGAGTYLWQAEYTVLLEGAPVVQKGSGFLNVLK